LFLERNLQTFVQKINFELQHDNNGNDEYILYSILSSEISWNKLRHQQLQFIVLELGKQPLFEVFWILHLSISLS
jgi:hypothetical protein